MFFRRFYLLLFFTFSVWTTSLLVQAEDSLPSSSDTISHNFYKSLGEFTWKLGNKRGIGLLDFMIPLYSQRHREILFLDLRFVRDNKSSREYNVGLAYRHALPTSRWADDPFVLGIYGFYDYRLSPNRNVFRQATLGVEALHPWIEGRANIYFPTHHQYVLPGTGANANSFSGFYYYTQSSNLKEGAMGGVDAEIGARVPLPWGHDYQLRFYGGGYKFQRSGYKTVAGPRFRTEFSIYNPLERIIDMPASRFKLGAEYAYDHVRGNIGFFDVGIRIPLGSFSDKKKQSNLDRAFQRTIERDVDIVALPSKPIVDLTPLTMAGTDGKPVRFYHVNGSAAAGGNGSAEAPFNAVQAAADAAGTDANNGFSAYPVIYVTGDCTGATAANVNFSSGAASNLSHITIISPAVSYASGGVTIPVSTNTKPTLSSSSTTSVIWAQTAGHNLSSIDIGGLQVTNNNSGSPVYVAGTGGASSPTHLTVNDSIIALTAGGAGAVGLTVYDHAYATITNTTISSSGSDGLFVRSNGTLAGGIVTRCTNCTIQTTSTGNNAVGAWLQANVQLTNCALSATSNADGYGLRLFNSQVAMSGGSISNAQFGVYADVTSTATGSGVITMTNVGTHTSSNGGSTITGF